jgi:hypothetical protein
MIGRLPAYGVAAAAINAVADIDPPRSWPNDRKQRFKSLPYDLQVYAVSHETQREKALRRAQNEVAALRQKLAASPPMQTATTKGTEADDRKGQEIDTHSTT